MRLNLQTTSLPVLLLTKEYYEAFENVTIEIAYDGNEACITCFREDWEKDFTDLYNDFLLRKHFAEETKTVKELIIGQALYGAIEEAESTETV